MNENENIIKEFISAWSELNAEKLAEFFTEDGIYHNIPIEPVQGKEQVKQFIAAFIQPWTSTTWDLLSIASEGALVIAERLDRTQAGEKSVDLPCVGIFQMEEGKIKSWKDYFDSKTYFDAMS